MDNAAVLIGRRAARWSLTSVEDGFLYVLSVWRDGASMTLRTPRRSGLIAAQIKDNDLDVMVAVAAQQRAETDGDISYLPLLSAAPIRLVLPQVLLFVCCSSSDFRAQILYMK